MKIVICGSMTAAKEMVEIESKLKSFGHDAVLPYDVHGYATYETQEQMHSEATKNKVEHDLIRDYYNKIADSDAILVVNIERKNIPGYIGGNSFLEMGFAHVLNKKIYLLNEIPDMPYKDELLAMTPIIINNNYSIIK
jgi:predicted RNA-binding protein with PUA domain